MRLCLCRRDERKGREGTSGTGGLNDGLIGCVSRQLVEKVVLAVFLDPNDHLNDHTTQSDDQNSASNESEREPSHCAILALRMAGIPSTRLSSRQEKRKVGQMVRLPTEELVLGCYALVLAKPFLLLLTVVAQAHAFPFLHVEGLGQTNDEGRIQLSDWIALRVNKSDVKNGTGQLLPR